MGVGMALVKCPECGRENVSDNAESCPDCGYGIRTYFEKKKDEENRKEELVRKLNSIPMPREPEKPFANLGAKIIIGFFVFEAILGIIVDGNWFLTIVCIGIIFMFFGIEYSNYNKELEKYKNAKEDFERYKKEELKRQQLAQVKEALKPRCPQCGSTNIEKISTTSRVVSIAAVGLASEKIGKQYKCKKCKHLW